MMRFTGCKLGLAIVFAALAVGANAQTATGSNAKDTTAAAGANTAPKAPSAMKKSTKSPMAKRGTATHRSAANRGRGANSTEANVGDSAYRAALRRCVSGPESQRDSCLDEAIARHGRA